MCVCEYVFRVHALYRMPYLAVLDPRYERPQSIRGRLKLERTFGYLIVYFI